VDTLLYDYEVEKLYTGASYGNIDIFARCDASSNLAGLWLASDDQFYCGRLVMNYAVGGRRVPAERTQFRATHQTTVYHLDNLEVQQTFFVPLGTIDLRAAYLIMRLRNFGEEPLKVDIRCSIQYPWFVWPGFTKLPDASQKNKRVSSRVENDLVITQTIGRPSEVRVLGVPLPFVEQYFDDSTARLDFVVELGGRADLEVPLVMVISNEGEAVALASYERCKDYQLAFATTNREMERLLSFSDVLVPDPIITRAVKWAKVNIVREQKNYPIGYGFTNDPPQDILVVRDIAWFSIGSDYITPWFSHGMLRVVQEYGIMENGEVAEYMVACENPPYKTNYGLNINDDTPLYVFAVHHHYALTGDRNFLEQMFPTIKNIAEYILAQKRGGLIWCTSEESNVWGIAGWRNMIPEYQISGAVTEINAECYMALRLAGRLAEAMGESELAARYLEEALKLKEECNRQLISEVTGLYVLNIDNNGVAHHDLTGDLVFPVLFGLADERMRRHILNVLFSREFWTEYGIRTVGRNEPEYDPEYAMRLMGGIWPNLTAWVAYASRIDYPEKTIEAMRNLYRISEVPNPRAFKNVVPGAFPEALHGDNFQSRGMAQSPWVAPTYLWLAIDGVLGLRPSVDDLQISPCLPESWQWCAVRNIPFRGGRFSYFFNKGVLYTDRRVKTGYQMEIFEEDVTDSVECNAYTIALRRGDETVIFVGTHERQGVVLTVKPPLVATEQRFEFVLNPSDCRVLTVHYEPYPAAEEIGALAGANSAHEASGPDRFYTPSEVQSRGLMPSDETTSLTSAAPADVSDVEARVSQEER
jgi:hypothetical protein